LFFADKGVTIVLSFEPRTIRPGSWFSLWEVRAIRAAAANGIEVAVKLGIIGDIHSNLSGLESVLEAMRIEHVDTIVCAGDVVGYGASPRRCIELLQALSIPCVMGNHDEYVTQADRTEWRIRTEAQEVILWTRRILPSSHLEWLASLPRSIEIAGVQIVHSSHLLWPPWRYIVNALGVASTFMFQRTQVSFNAHTHVPILATHRCGSPPRVKMLSTGELDPKAERFLIGVGSVGQPRDGDPRASAVIFDTDKRHVRLLRVPYNVGEAQEEIRRAGLPESLAERLACGR